LFDRNEEQDRIRAAQYAQAQSYTSSDAEIARAAERDRMAEDARAWEVSNAIHVLSRNKMYFHTSCHHIL
jgi:hypothetical protein